MDATEVVKVSFGKTIVICGDDWQFRIFSSASQPSMDRTYFVLTESPYDGHTLEMMTEAQIDDRLAAISKGSAATPASFEDALRQGNQERTMREYVFPPLTPHTKEDF